MVLRGAFREDTLARKVYYVQPALSSEELLYDFNLQLGDTVQGFLRPAAGIPDTVIAIDSIQIGPLGNYVKRWFVNSLNSIYLIEGVGCTYGLVEKTPGTSPGWNERNINCMNGITYTYPFITDCELITSVNSPELQTSLRIFPNPSSGIFNISIPFNGYELEIMSALGQIIHREKDCRSFDITGYCKGIYLVRIIKDHNIYSQRLIIQ